LTELTAAVTEAFAKDEIGVGHALLLAKLQPAEQEQALSACFREDWNGGQGKAKRILLPVRHLHQWIEQNILLILKDAPFSKTDPNVNPAAGACVDCPKRTGGNALLFADIAEDACTDPACYQSKLDGFVAQTIAAKPKLVQISSAFGPATTATDGGSAALPRNKYIEIKPQDPNAKKHRDWPEYQTCKSMTEAIVTEGTEKGELRKICADPECPVHRPKKQRPAGDQRIKAEQEKQRREEALANAVGLRVLSAIVAAVPVRLTKRDLVFIVERLLPSWRSGASRFSPGIAASRRRKPPTFHREADGRLHSQGRGRRTRKLLSRDRHSPLSPDAIGDRQGAQRSRPALQGGHRRHRPEGQSGVCREREGASRQEDGREGPAKTGAAHSSQKGQSRVTLNFQALQTGSAERRPRSFSPVFPPFDVLPLRARLGLAHPTGLNLKLKADVNPVTSLHKNGSFFTASRTFKSGETIPVLLIGGAILSLEMSANTQNSNDFKPSLAIYADDSSASDRTSAMSAWLIEMKHVAK
jgi:hypothetical protein